MLAQASSGDVGTVAIQLAKHLGAQVAATVGPDILVLAEELVADVAIDYSHEAVEPCLSGYGVVLETLGGEALHRSLEVLKAGGKLISISGPPAAGLPRQIGMRILIRQQLRLASRKVRSGATRRGVDGSSLFMRADGSQLAEIAEFVDAGAIRPIIEPVSAFDESPAALARVVSGRARGKVVIRVAPDIAQSRAKC